MRKKKQEVHADQPAGALDAAREALDGDRPRPEWVRGQCPKCGQPLVSNCYYVASRGFLVFFECWGSLGRLPTCDYRKVINPED